MLYTAQFEFFLLVKGSAVLFKIKPSKMEINFGQLMNVSISFIF